MIKHSALVIVTTLLVSCSDPQPQPATDKPFDQTVASTAPQQQQPGFAERAADAAVAGAAAGAAGTVAHHATNGAINHVKKARRAKRIQRIRSRRR